MESTCGFDDFFKTATGGSLCFPYQRRFAEASELPALVNVPTGLGKTAMAVIGWLWRRHGASDKLRNQTPRRLVYCLPMRVLVEQTAESGRSWNANLRQAGVISSDVPVCVLMGGEDEDNWDLYPERDAIIIGTQDMLLSRALNRGYAASRSRWPMQFGLLHTDCLWVFDEIQLMGSGLATTAQLEAFRHRLGSEDGHGCRSVWMSATLDRSWLETVGFKSRVPSLPLLELDEEDRKHPEVIKRFNAKKQLFKTTASIGDVRKIAVDIVQTHVKIRGLTLAVVNTVKRSRELYEAVDKSVKENLKVNAPPRLVLLHSRFRPPDRKKKIDELLNPALNKDMICISTQVVEAGVDVDATTLFTELAPWAALVQRFGRCNRRGERNEQAQVYWVDLPAKKAEAEKVARPYHEQFDELSESAKRLAGLADVGIKTLPKYDLPFAHTHVIRKRDLIDLFDTTPDLAGNDIDIDRYVRDIGDADVRVYWRDWDTNEHKTPPNDKTWRRVTRDELCPAPIGDFKKFAESTKARSKVWRWDFLDGEWRRVNNKSDIYPGQTYLVHASAGGYHSDTGWVGTQGKAVVVPIGPVDREGLSDDAYDDEGLSKTDRWQTIAEHTDDVCTELDDILASLSLNNGEMAALRTAARWHDWGKAHDIFQAVLPEGAPRANELWAKASGQWKRYRDVRRPHFRHELASAMAVLQRLHSELSKENLSDEDLNLVAYLIAAHHGKVRLSIRSMPNEMRPCAANGRPRRFARGVWDGDELPETALGNGVTAPRVTLSLEPMELGLCEQPPFIGEPSWIERMIHLRDAPGAGPFRMAYLEALLRAADWRASERASSSTTQPGPRTHATEVANG